MKRSADRGLVEVGDGIAIRFLIACVDKRVERKWIIIRRGDFFLDERAKDAAFVLREYDVHARNHIPQRRLRHIVTYRNCGDDSCSKPDRGRQH